MMESWSFGINLGCPFSIEFSDKWFWKVIVLQNNLYLILLKQETFQLFVNLCQFPQSWTPIVSFALEHHTLMLSPEDIRACSSLKILPCMWF